MLICRIQLQVIERVKILKIIYPFFIYFYVLVYSYSFKLYLISFHIYKFLERYTFEL